MIPRLCPRLSGPDPRAAGDSGIVYFGLGPAGRGAAACVPLKIGFRSRHLIFILMENIRKNHLKTPFKEMPFGKRTSLESEEGPGTRFWFSRNLWALSIMIN